MRTLLLLGLVALCVASADAKPRKQPASIVLVIDRSGSMQGAKLRRAKDAVIAAMDALDPDDHVTLVTFDSDSKVVFADRLVSDRGKLKKLVERIEAGGGTNIFPALKEAFEDLSASQQKQRHVLMMTDGESPSDGLPELLEHMRAAGITISALGVAGADRDLLAMIADAGAGRLYMVQDIDALPKLFVREMKTALDR